jgi:diguanylate cyclase (GGDEF)-like protein
VSGPSGPEGRDRAANERDRAADQRDEAAEQRDRAAQQRDESAEQSGTSARAWVTRAAGERSDPGQREAALDRTQASQDRAAGASERTHAEHDRETARADREASASEREHAAVDALTGVYLRDAGFAELERQVARSRRTQQPLVVAFVDVDRLKTVNDARGHAAGDRMLAEVASALRAGLRSYDLIIRYGGDEFVCAISDVDLAAAAKRLATINAALADGPAHGSVTVGIAELQPGDSPEDIVARADAALYRERQQQGRTRA